jgi:hypothetical protein
MRELSATAHICYTSHKNAITDSIYAQNFMQSVFLVAEETDLVTWNDVPVLYEIFGAN